MEVLTGSAMRCFRVFTYYIVITCSLHLCERDCCCHFVYNFLSVIISFCLNLVQIYILLMLYKFEPIFCYGTYSLGNILLVISVV